MNAIHARTVCAVFALAMCSLGTAHAQTQEVSGVKLERQIEVGGTKLVLNGAGTRYHLIFKAYVGALYLQAPTTSLDEALSTAKPHRLQIVFATSSSASGLGNRFVKGAPKDSKEQMSKLIPGLLAVGNGFQGVTRLNPGDVLNIDWIPDKGTFFVLNGRQVVDTIKEPEFNTFFMRQWLGDAPHDKRLRDQMLGHASERRTEQ
jgi:hypothetical protein